MDDKRDFSIALFDARKYDRQYFDAANAADKFAIRYFEMRLDPVTARLAEGHDAVCVFVNDEVGADTIGVLAAGGVRLIALRCAGYNNVDLAAAERAGIPVVRVPAYSPYAVAEHTVALLLCLNRKIHRAYNRVREGNFSLSGLVGFDLHGKTFGIIGTGRIGRILAGIVKGFGCRVLVSDKFPDAAWAGTAGVEYVERDRVYAEADFISLLAPLSHETYHMINFHSLAMMKPNVILVNTSRGALIDSAALVEALKNNRIGGACLDVYEEEAGFFYQDLSDTNISDDILARLLTFNNVLITSHQAFLTHEALVNIAATTLDSVRAFIGGQELENRVAGEP